jgi:hypothetical protein
MSSVQDDGYGYKEWMLPIFRLYIILHKLVIFMGEHTGCKSHATPKKQICGQSHGYMSIISIPEYGWITKRTIQ